MLSGAEVVIRVEYSFLNYKDALSASGKRGVTGRYPHTPGIDAAGRVVLCPSGVFRQGDPVIVTGYDLGMNSSGGFGRYIGVPEGWVVRLPRGLTLKESMAFGTAGLTAAMAAEVILERLRSQAGPVLVTGAGGGVGCLSVALLSDLGYRVVAVTGKAGAAALLRDLGAESILSREEALDAGGRPLLPCRWAGVIDTVGGGILSTAVRSVQPGGTVVSCGNASSPELTLTVYPFILRGIGLIGIDSQNCLLDRCLHIWKLLAGKWKTPKLPLLHREIPLERLGTAIGQMLRGEITGRLVIDHGQ